MTAREAARLIDISAVRTQHNERDVLELVELGEKYHFINLHVLPCWVPTLAKRIAHLDDVYVGSPVGFPGGGHTTQTKLAEARQPGSAASSDDYDWSDNWSDGSGGGGGFSDSDGGSDSGSGGDFID